MPPGLAKGGQIQKIVYMEGFKVISVNNAYIRSKSRFAHETVVVLSSRYARLPIYAYLCAKLRFGVSSEAPRWVKFRKL